jgi:hypothetical protein
MSSKVCPLITHPHGISSHPPFLNLFHITYRVLTDPSIKILDLTGTHPSPNPSPSPEQETADTLAGTTHLLSLATNYYTASVPIWLDLIASPAEWSASFLSAEAKEVLDVLGGVIVVFSLPSASSSSLGSDSASTLGTSSSQTPPAQTSPEGKGRDGHEQVKQLVTHVGNVVREGLGGWEWDGVSLAVGIGEGEDAELDEWEDLCAQSGLEFVHVPRLGGGDTGKGEQKNGRNEFGERMGMSRIVEALEANDWSGGGMGGDGEDEEEEDHEDDRAAKGKGLLGDEEDDEFDPERLGFGFDREDFVGLRQAIWGGGGGRDGEEEEEVGEDDVQKLERMMMKLQAVRDASAGLPEEQRKRMAARAVGEVMKEL